ncbi:MAG: DUF1800 family protein, partial [Rubricoccaceae bacterium]|nr:DUF1800 family protein [Rubricoccaceae bacterium]
NYTQQDIAEAARALTGWVVNMNNLTSEFVPSRHDSGQKTIFGQTGNYNYDSFITLLIQQRTPQIAHFIATKLYSWFVHPAPNDTVVEQLASDLQNNNFSIAHALRRLLKSAHFFDDAFIGARIKSPAEYMVGILRGLSISPSGSILERFREMGFALGQDILNPPNVAGWPGYSPDEYRAWITTGTIPDRSSIIESAIYGGSGFEELDTLALASDLSDPTDANAIIEDFVAHLLPAPVSEEVVDTMIDILMQGSPVWEWVVIYTSDPDSAAARLRDLLSFIMNLPEHQLT